MSMPRLCGIALCALCTALPAAAALVARASTSSQATRGGDDKVCMASAIALDFEGHRVLDWVAYHSLRGVNCFIFYHDISKSNLTNPRTLGIHKLLEASPIVTMFNTSYSERLGEEAGPTIREVADKLGGMRYLAVIDVDEFIMTDRDVNLTETLGSLVGSTNQLGLYLNRWSFGTNGHVDPTPVDKPEFYYLTERTGNAKRTKMDDEEPKTGKVILNLASGVDLWGVHSWHSPEDRPDAHMLLPDATELEAADGIHFINRYHHHQPVWINHYITGSLSQCLEKASMGEHHRSRFADCKKLHPGAKEYNAARMRQDREITYWADRTRRQREVLFPGAQLVFQQ